MPERVQIALDRNSTSNIRRGVFSRGLNKSIHPYLARNTLLHDLPKSKSRQEAAFAAAFELLDDALIGQRE
jgi:hypothetical protein